MYIYIYIQNVDVYIYIQNGYIHINIYIYISEVCRVLTLIRDIDPYIHIYRDRYAVCVPSFVIYIVTYTNKKQGEHDSGYKYNPILGNQPMT